MGEYNTQLFSWNWPANNDSIHPIVTSIVDTIMFSIVNVGIASLPDPSQKIQELWGSQEEPNADGGLHACNVTPIFQNNTAASWVKAVMRLNNPTVFRVLYRGQ